MSRRRTFLGLLAVTFLVIGAVIAVAIATRDNSTPAMAGGRWQDALGRIPNTGEEYLYLSVTDFVRMRAAKLPDDQKFHDARLALSDLRTSDTQKDSLVKPHDTDLVMDSRTGYAVMRGNYDENAVHQSLLKLQERSHLKYPIEQSTIAGHETESFGSSTNATNLVRTRVDKNHIYTGTGRMADPAAPMPDGASRMADLLKALSDRDLSLAEHERFPLLLPGTDELSLFEATLADDVYSISTLQELLRDEYGKAVDATRAEPLLLEYDSFAVGWSVDDAGPFVGLVILNPNEATARTNASRLRSRVDVGKSFRTGKPWHEIFSDSQIRSEGRLTIARLYTASAHQFWKKLLDDIENLWMIP